MIENSGEEPVAGPFAEPFQESETEPVLDVHPPHEAIHGWRDFLLHLLTITIGLLIALSLEGCVEWQHHRRLVHEAEASLHAEIKGNADSLKDTEDDIHKQQASLKHDVVVLNRIIKDGKAPADDRMEISFHLRGFDDVSWKTAQSTGALSYMQYSAAQEYAEIYNTQNEIDIAQHQAVQAAILSLAPLVNDDASGPTPDKAKTMEDRIGVLQGQLILLDSLVASLDGQYKKFLSAHP